MLGFLRKKLSWRAQFGAQFFSFRTIGTANKAKVQRVFFDLLCDAMLTPGPGGRENEVVFFGLPIGLITTTEVFTLLTAINIVRHKPPTVRLLMDGHFSLGPCRPK